MRRWIKRALWAIWGLIFAAVLVGWFASSAQPGWSYGYVWKAGAYSVSGYLGIFDLMRVTLYPTVAETPRKLGFVRRMLDLPIGGVSTQWRFVKVWGWGGVIGYEVSICRWGEQRHIYIRGGAAVSALALPGVVWLILSVSRWLRRTRRMRQGLCPQCGYDLRATPGRCPECGHEPAPAPVVALPPVGGRLH